METVINKLKSHESTSQSKWKEEAKVRIEKKGWLRYSQRISMMMLDKMEEQGMTQKELADKMQCSQQYVSKILKGTENLSLETIFKISSALNITFELREY